MQKILHIIPRFTTGGAERLVLEYTRNCDKSKVEAAVGSVRGGGELLREFACMVVTEDVLGFASEWRPDIVHTHMLSGDLTGYVLKRRFPNIRWVSTQHNSGRYASRPRRFLWQWILRRADAVIAVSGEIESYCRDVWKVSAEKIWRISNAIPTEKFLDIPPMPSTAPMLWELATIGRLEKQKGHDILLAALAKLRDLSWRFSLYGSGSQKSHIFNLSRSGHIEGRVFFQGVEDAVNALRAVRIVIQPSRWEGRSLAVMEAMAAGRCVIASAAAGAELIEDKKTGIVAPVGDVSALASAIRRVIETPEEAVRLGAAARAYASEHFGFDAWMKAMDELYQSI